MSFPFVCKITTIWAYHQIYLSQNFSKLIYVNTGNGQKCPFPVF